MRLRSIFQTVAEKVKYFINREDEVLTYFSPKEPDKVSAWAWELYNDALSYREDEFRRTIGRQFNFSNLDQWYRALELIYNGDHWSVWGTRRRDPIKDTWKAEEVDDEVTDQMRVRLAHILAQWRQITITPNVNNSEELLDHENRITGWDKMLTELILRTQVYGEAWVRSFLDTSTYFYPVANEKVCRIGSILLSPYATGIESSEGCSYIIEASMVTGQQIKADFPDIDLGELSQGTTSQFDSLLAARLYYDKTTSYKHTKIFPKLEIFMDDPTVEDAPFDKEKFDAALRMLLSGEVVPVNKYEDNHAEYVKHYQEYLDELAEIAEQQVNEGTLTEEDQQLAEDKADIIVAQINKHIEAAEESGFKAGKRPKYPFGRHIIVIGNKVVWDKPNEYKFDWRNLFTRVVNESVPERLFGRGDVEIMWNVQKGLDESMSRLLDLTLASGIAKKARHISDKKIVEETGDTNNPDDIDWFNTQPPTYTKAPPPSELLQYYIRQKENARAQKLGITAISRGSSLGANASGDLAEVLAAQNDVVIRGQLSDNLDDAIARLVETKLLILKQFGTHPRIITIGGVETVVVPSDMLQTTKVMVDGEPVTVPIDKFEVHVNSPGQFDKWRNEITLLTALQKSLIYPDGTPAIPVEALLDKLSERYPHLGANGKYRTLNKLVQIGLQTIKSQLQQQKGVNRNGQIQQEQAEVGGNGARADQPAISG